ncbi:MAG: ABC-type transport auxiliary lipoprotein family protein [Steroidobacteraceae bacterium]
MTRFTRALGALALLALGGCSLLPPHAQPPRYEDFGPPAIARPPAGPALRLRGVEAPAWLDTGAIDYRFLTHHPHQLRAYAQHRWIAPPSALLAQSLRERLPGGAARRVLRVRLLRFEQDFESARRARALIALRATVTELQGRWSASRQFVLSVPAAPNVTGAVAGLSAAARRASAAIVAWARTVRSPAHRSHG